ncbi:MAG: AAA family ATPase [Catonella sp.]|uniref:ATP-binding protein n=1 Tax=Catonella sp. TaxID=2382125 RepID=UPI003F9F48C5
MRIGLYGLPSAGKSFILGNIRNLEVLSGSSLLQKLAPNFNNLAEEQKETVRQELALQLRQKDSFIMDGHYSFGENIVFTEADGQLYDVFLYLYINPDIILERMSDSIKNKKYLQYDIEEWQRFELESLRTYCHINNKDFYVIDNPDKGFFSDIRIILEFIDSIIEGYSCVRFAKEVANKIEKSDFISLSDGDKTFIKEDSSEILGYKTHLFDGNFYSGFQAWRHNSELMDYLKLINYSIQSIDNMNLTINEKVQDKIKGFSVILTTGYYDVWKQIAYKYNLPLFCGSQMCSDTKYFITKFLQERGSKVMAFGDSMNDYFMLKQANISYLMLKKDGSISSSLRGRDLEGLILV